MPSLPKARRKRVIRTIAYLLITTAVLAILSMLTSGITWSGGYPQAEVRLNVRDSNGTPIPGARLTISRGMDGQRAWGRPIENFTEARALVSDDTGQITALSQRGGVRFGGQSWMLFWVIPMGAKPPRYDCELTAPGFAPLRFEVSKLFRTAHRHSEELPKARIRVDDPRWDGINGGGHPQNGEYILPIYEHTFTLNRL